MGETLTVGARRVRGIHTCWNCPGVAATTTSHRSLTLSWILGVLLSGKYSSTYSVKLLMGKRSPFKKTCVQSKTLGAQLFSTTITIVCLHADKAVLK